jgi:hypothetical protein
MLLRVGARASLASGGSADAVAAGARVRMAHPYRARSRQPLTTPKLQIRPKLQIQQCSSGLCSPGTAVTMTTTSKVRRRMRKQRSSRNPNYRTRMNLDPEP